MEFRLLGPVEIEVPSGVLPARRPQQDLVLAALLADAGRLMTTESLAERVWGLDPPERARRALHAHIARIRRQLRSVADAGDELARLERRTGGYILTVDRDHVDWYRFQRLTERARTECRGTSQRVDLLREALELWRGEPLAGLSSDWATRIRDVWNQQYLQAALAWAHAEVEAGNPGTAVGPLMELHDRYPYTEPLAAMLMQVMSAAGRPAEALIRYETVRQRLVNELGADPGPELRRMHQAILRGEVA